MTLQEYSTESKSTSDNEAQRGHRQRRSAKTDIQQQQPLDNVVVENFMKTLENWSAKAVFFVQNYRYLFFDEVLCIYCATHSVIFLVSPFVQLKSKSKMAARYVFQRQSNCERSPAGNVLPWTRAI